jgi:hypothetical protein
MLCRTVGQGRRGQEGLCAAGRGLAQVSGPVAVSRPRADGFRGGLLVGSALYAAWNNKATTFTSGGVETTLTGTLNGTEKVFWARNNKSPTPDVVCVAPGTGAFTVTSAAVSSFADPDIGTPNSVGFMDGFFIFTYGDGTLQASGLNDVTISHDGQDEGAVQNGRVDERASVQRSVYRAGASLRRGLQQHGAADRVSVHALLCAAARLVEPLCDRRP